MDGHTCNNSGCGKPAKLQCPNCLKLQLPQALPLSFFCSQECFKATWPTHKVLHTTRIEGYDPYPSYAYTGTLRPWPYGPKRTVPPTIARPEYAETGIPESEIRERGSTKIHTLTQEEAEKMRTVCRLTREVLDLVAAAVKPGVTTDELDRIVHEAVLARNAYPSPLNYHNFPKSFCTSVNEVICHGIPDLRPLQDGDIINLDVTLYYDGFHGDLNETYFVGSKVDAAGQHLVNTARECLEQAIAAVKPGTQYKDLGAIIQKHAHANGLSVVRSYCGHGVHRLFHTTPNVPHYAKNKAVGVMKPGHCFTIEPMICEGTYQDKLWPDDWTAVTTDGKRSAQFEHTLLVTETGVEILTAANIKGSNSTFSSVFFNARALGNSTEPSSLSSTASQTTKTVTTTNNTIDS